MHVTRALVTNFYPADYDYVQNFRHRLYITIHGRDLWCGQQNPLLLIDLALGRNQKDELNSASPRKSARIDPDTPTTEPSTKQMRISAVHHMIAGVIPACKWLASMLELMRLLAKMERRLT